MVLHPESAYYLYLIRQPSDYFSEIPTAIGDILFTFKLDSFFSFLWLVLPTLLEVVRHSVQTTFNCLCMMGGKW